LADESRLPLWFDLPEGLSRRDVSVTLSYYVMPWGRSATLVMRARDGRWIASTKAAQRGLEPLTLVPREAGKPRPHPVYEILTSGEITEVIEHRRMEPVFYITDDPEVKRRFGVQPGQDRDGK
jgi:hypothetical protein